MMEDGLWVEKLDVDEAAMAMRRTPEWVQGVIDGTVDPTLDELELALNAIGLETRVSVERADKWLSSSMHNREKLAKDIARHRAQDLEDDMEMFGTPWVQRWPPQPGVTARMFSAGPKRTDGGGWAAILMGDVLQRILGVSEACAAEQAGLPETQIHQMASGEWRPTADQFEEIVASLGMHMGIRLEEYETHDDELHAMWEAGPDGSDDILEAKRKEVQIWMKTQKAETILTSN